MDTVYVVEGSRGEYSDQSTWLVVVYPTFEQAKEHCIKAAQAAADMLRRGVTPEYDYAKEVWEGETNPYDPSMEERSYHQSYDYAVFSVGYEAPHTRHEVMMYFISTDSNLCKAEAPHD